MIVSFVIDDAAVFLSTLSNIINIVYGYTMNCKYVIIFMMLCDKVREISI